MAPVVTTPPYDPDTGSVRRLMAYASSCTVPPTPEWPSASISRYSLVSFSEMLAPFEPVARKFRGYDEVPFASRVTIPLNAVWLYTVTRPLNVADPLKVVLPAE